MLRNISPVFYALGFFIALTYGIAALEAQPSGALQAGYAFTLLFAVAAGYNRLRNGSWLSDFSGGN